MAERPRDPLWRILERQGRSVKWLAERMGLTYQHVRLVSGGFRKPNDRFRREAARVMEIPEDILFLASCAADEQGETSDARTPIGAAS